MFDHGTLTVGDFPKAKSFYKAVLASLSMKSLAGDGKTYCGFGVKKPSFWIAAAETADPVSTSVQVAFVGTDKSRVDSFHQAAMAVGAKNNGSPGYHREYGAGYYAAFVFDLDGNNIETVYRDPVARLG
jgi:catechol 2,3-dioxygenase-like lactoylglutathione lyase family enzyme